jgi:hypothetical protein
MWIGMAHTKLVLEGDISILFFFFTEFDSSCTLYTTVLFLFNGNGEGAAVLASTDPLIWEFSFLRRNSTLFLMCESVDIP